MAVVVAELNVQPQMVVLWLQPVDFEPVMFWAPCQPTFVVAVAV